MPKLIAFAGLPGVGKTTLAQYLARTLGAVYLRIDTIEQALALSSARVPRSEDAGYQAAFHVAKDNLILGRDVVADSVNPIEESRQMWAQTASQSNARLVQVEVICADTAEHRRRVESRSSDIEGLRLPTWDQVQGRTYAPWTTNRIIIDTARKTINAACAEMLRNVEK